MALQVEIAASAAAEQARMANLYPQFASAMEAAFPAATYPDYRWEGLRVETDDDYVLTLFHVWEQGQMNSNLGPVMFQHGAGKTGSEFLETSIPDHVETFIEAGHHVYVGNNRGIEYSREHKTLDPVLDDDLYWDFSWADMAYDVYANVDKMYARTSEFTGNNKKGVYIGNSQGTVQMTVALAENESRLLPKLSKVIEMAPCTVSGDGPKGVTDLTQESMSQIGAYESVGVYSLPTNDWSNDLTAICDNLSPQLCGKAQGQTQTQPYWKATKTLEHWAMNRMTQRFQKYVDNWAYPNDHVAQEYDLSQITMPMTLVVGAADSTCTLEWAEWLRDSLSSLEYYVVIAGGEHGAPLSLDDPVSLQKLVRYVQTSHVRSTLRTINL